MNYLFHLFIHINKVVIIIISSIIMSTIKSLRKIQEIPSLQATMRFTLHCRQSLCKTSDGMSDNFSRELSSGAAGRDAAQPPPDRAGVAEHHARSQTMLTYSPSVNLPTLMVRTPQWHYTSPIDPSTKPLLVSHTNPSSSHGVNESSVEWTSEHDEQRGWAPFMLCGSIRWTIRIYGCLHWLGLLLLLHIDTVDSL